MIKKPFTLKSRLQSFRHAGRGLAVFFSRTHNAWVHGAAAAGVAALGVFFRLSPYEWAFIFGAMGMVFLAEAANSAIEYCVDIASPGHHELARDAKDVAAAAVLIAAVAAVGIGAVIFVPHIREAIGAVAPASHSRARDLGPTPPIGAAATGTPISAPLAVAGKIVALTFDDGPYGTSTADILSILEAQSVPATFFLIGRNVERHPEEVAREVADGDVVGNHSYDHSRMIPFLPVDQLRMEISRAEDAIIAAGGVQPHLFRPPYGATSPAMLAELEREGYSAVDWNVDPRDWDDSVSSTSIASSVLDRVRSGDVVLLHDGHEYNGYGRSNTVEALPAIIAGLKARGYRFVTVDKIVASQPYDGAILKPL